MGSMGPEGRVGRDPGPRDPDPAGPGGMVKSSIENLLDTNLHGLSVPPELQRCGNRTPFERVPSDHFIYVAHMDPCGSIWTQESIKQHFVNYKVGGGGFFQHSQGVA